MRTVILNRSNLIEDGQNNKLVFKFPSSVKFDKSYVSVSSVSMYYSWFNITASLGNNTFTYYWKDRSVTPQDQTTTITIPDGLYNIDQLNTYLQSTLILANRYLINTATGAYKFYLEFLINPTRYAVQINLGQVPSSVTNIPPAGFTAPTAGFNYSLTTTTVGFPLADFSPYLTIGQKLGDLIGFEAGTIPSPTTTAASEELSTKSPNLQPNATVLISCSGVDNPVAQPSSIIYSITPSVGVGEAIIDKPPAFLWCKLISGFYNQFQVTLLGTDLNPLKINDPQMTIILAFAQEDEVKTK